MAFMHNFEVEEKTKRRKEQSNPLKHTLSKLIQNIDILEKFYSDKEYRDRFDKAEYLSSDYFQLEKIEEQQEKIKQKLSLPRNGIIRYEKVRCSRNCIHDTHRYYYAYIWDGESKKLKKKYIGKQLPVTS
jgi:uncharacterized protein with HEPN domain